MYGVITVLRAGSPPLGGTHVTVALRSAPAATTDVSAGGAPMRTAADDDDAGPAPPTIRALTWNVYVWPLVRPERTWTSAVDAKELVVWATPPRNGVTE